MKKAFTLVEVLVVVLVLAILMAVALPLYLGAVKSSELAAARSNMQTIANANQAHRLRKGSFTLNIADLADDLGTAEIHGPGTRTYSMFRNGNCDHDADPDTDMVSPPDGSFGVKSSEASDGCFIPGLSNK